MTQYIIYSKDGEEIDVYEGNYCDALDYAAQVLNIPEGKYVNDYAEIEEITDEE